MKKFNNRAVSKLQGKAITLGANEHSHMNISYEPDRCDEVESNEGRRAQLQWDGQPQAPLMDTFLYTKASPSQTQTDLT